MEEAEEMNANHLLFWASALGSGSWHQFKCAVERLHLENRQEEEQDRQEDFPLYQQARFNLQRLGHVEFNGQETDWQVVPPVFAMVEREGKAWAVLCGARSKPLLASIREACNSLELSETACDTCPDIFCLEDKDSDRIKMIAENLGIMVQSSAPETILVNLPPVETLINWPRSDMPFGEGWNKKRFCAQALSWERKPDLSDTNEQPELLRFTRFGKPFYFIRVGASGIQVPGQMGKFFILMCIRRRVLSYDSQRAELGVPPIYRPPLFVERALCLCSGFPATFEPKRKLLIYRNIPEHVAQLAARALRQEIP
jgi:hypothetical protein